MSNNFNLMNARWHMVNGLAQAGRLAEAEAMFATLAPDTKLANLAWYRINAQSGIESARQRQAADFIKQGKLAEFEGQLAREPWPAAYALARLELAKAYQQKNDPAGARRNADAAALGLSHAILAEGDNAFTFTLNRINVADVFKALGDLAASRRVLDATTAAIDKISKPDQKQYPIEYLAAAYARIAWAEAAAKDFVGAKTAALEVFKLANQMTNGGSRTTALSSIAGMDPRVGITNELVAVVDALPEGSAKQNLVGGLVKEFAGLGQDAKVLAMAGKIADLNSRKSALSDVISARISAGNWAAAIGLANDPAVSGRLYAEIAKKMLAAGMIKEAGALEPKFGAASSESDYYFTDLLSYRARNAEIDAAVQAALRRSTVPDQVSNLFSVASTAYSIGGPSAAKPVLDRAFGRMAELKSAGELYSACNAINHYFGHGSVFADGFPKADDQGANAVVGIACTAEALAIPAQKDRIDPLKSALASSYVVTHPVIDKTVAPTRAAISRLLAEASGLSPNSRDYAFPYAADRLAREGAIETALELADFECHVLQHRRGRGGVAHRRRRRHDRATHRRPAAGTCRGLDGPRRNGLRESRGGQSFGCARGPRACREGGGRHQCARKPGFPIRQHRQRRGRARTIRRGAQCSRTGETGGQAGRSKLLSQLICRDCRPGRRQAPGGIHRRNRSPKGPKHRHQRHLCTRHGHARPIEMEAARSGHGFGSDAGRRHRALGRRFSVVAGSDVCQHSCATRRCPASGQAGRRGPAHGK